MKAVCLHALDRDMLASFQLRQRTSRGGWHIVFNLGMSVPERRQTRHITLIAQGWSGRNVLVLPVVRAHLSHIRRPARRDDGSEGVGGLLIICYRQPFVKRRFHEPRGRLPSPADAPPDGDLQLNAAGRPTPSPAELTTLCTLRNRPQDPRRKPVQVELHCRPARASSPRAPSGQSECNGIGPASTRRSGPPTRGASYGSTP